MKQSWAGQFVDRVDAGRQLAGLLLKHLPAVRTEQSAGAPFPNEQRANTIVLGLPRGGVPVAAEVARALKASLDVVLVRKLGLPGRPEVAMGAIGESGAEVRNQQLITQMRVTPTQLDAVKNQEERTLDARAARLRRGRARRDLTGLHVILVDDGIATGSTAAVACQVVRHLGAARITLAVPVIPRELAAGTAAATKLFGPDVEVISVYAPREFWAVGAYYTDFSETTDAEVESLLNLHGPDPH